MKNSTQKNKRIIFITRRFPYFKTEAFIESEIVELALEFDEILIFPSEVSDDIRSVPSNVRVLDDFARSYQNKGKRALSTLCSTYFWFSIFRHLRRIRSTKDIISILRFCSNVKCYERYFLNFDFQKGDLVYTYWFTEAPVAFIRLREHLNLGISIVSRAHRFDLYEKLPTTVRFWPYRKFALEHIDRVYSISEDGKDYLEKNYGVIGKVDVAKLGVFDRNKLSPSSSRDNICIVSVSRVVVMKRVDLIAEVVSAYAKQHKSLSITWIHFGDGEQLELVKSRIPKLSNLTVDLRGMVPNSEIYHFYEISPVSLFINLSTSEGIPVSIMEAQSYGIPVIATDVGGTSEIVNQRNGVLLHAKPTLDEVLEAIEFVLVQKMERADIKKWWDNNFNAEKNYKEFVRDLKKIQ